MSLHYHDPISNSTLVTGNLDNRPGPDAVVQSNLGVSPCKFKFLDEKPGFFQDIIASDVKTIEAMEAAFCRATRTTLAGSTMPSVTIQT